MLAPLRVTLLLGGHISMLMRGFSSLELYAEIQVLILSAVCTVKAYNAEFFYVWGTLIWLSLNCLFLANSDAGIITFWQVIGSSSSSLSGFTSLDKAHYFCDISYFEIVVAVSTYCFTVVKWSHFCPRLRACPCLPLTADFAA